MGKFVTREQIWDTFLLSAPLGTEACRLELLAVTLICGLDGPPPAIEKAMSVAPLGTRVSAGSDTLSGAEVPRGERRCKQRLCRHASCGAGGSGGGSCGGTVSGGFMPAGGG